MNDEPIPDVIADALWASNNGNASLGGCPHLAADILDALRAAGLEVGPADTFKLGEAVRKVKPRLVNGLRGEEREQALTTNDLLRFIYAEAGVERP